MKKGITRSVPLQTKRGVLAAEQIGGIASGHHSESEFTAAEEDL